MLTCFRPFRGRDHGITLALLPIAAPIRPILMTRRVALLVCLLSSPVATSPDSAAAPQEAEPRVIDVVARRYMFEPSQIEVTQGERIRIVLTTADGLHGFEIKKLKISKEVPRGSKPIVIDFTADAAGEFPIVCSAFCGDGHENMKGMLVVQAREKTEG